MEAFMRRSTITRRISGASLACTILNQELFDFQLQVLDLDLELGTFVGGYGAGDDGPGDTAGATQRRLGGQEHVRHILILAQQR